MHLLKLSDWTPEFMLAVIDLGAALKADRTLHGDTCRNRTLLMFFEKPSLRTRLSFETGMTRMGGHAIYYNIKDSALGKKENIHDFAKVACRYADIIMCRLFSHTILEEIAENSSAPVINGLTDFSHPCQILADLMTVREKKGRLAGLKLAYFGDSFNNVTHSLIYGCAMTGMDIAVGCPDNAKMSPDPAVIDEGLAIAKKTGSKIEVFHEAAEAAEGADVVYTDSWMSYHICLPAMRGYEQTADVIDGPQSVVFDEAENRMHAQKAVILKLLELA